jgi:3-dehydroquinate dehydratase type II
MRRVLVLNGPNLNLLGSRRPDVYGSTTLADLERLCAAWGTRLGVEVESFQSNHEGSLIDRLHAAMGTIDGLVINPGALTHTSYALHDALEAVEIPAVEVHISNVEEREPWRRISVTGPACVHRIYGRGIYGYQNALSHLVARAALPFTTVPYGHHRDQIADLRLPEGDGPHPVAVLLHGGFFLGQYTRDLMDGAAVDLTRRGVATWNAEYRRLGDEGGYPATLRDVAAAVDALSGLSSPLDLNRVALIGHSAGGYLAVWAAARRGLGEEWPEATTIPQLVTTLACFGDPVEAATASLGGGAVGRFLAAAATPADLATVNPLLRLPCRARHLANTAADDPVVPPEHTRRYVAAAETAGDPVETAEYDSSHFDLIDPTGDAWSAIAARTSALLIDG